MTIAYPCRVCNHPVAKNHKAIKCDKCGLWVHIKCNKINVQTYNLLQKDNSSWYCISCVKTVFPFSDLNNHEFHTTIQGKKIKYLTVSRKRSPNENILIDRLNGALNENELENPSSYFDIDDLNSNFPINEFDGTNFLHMNISSLSHNFDEFHALLKQINVKLQVIGITESRLIKNKTRLSNIDLNGYSIEHTPTEANCGGALLYINSSLNYLKRNDLTQYKKKELEFVFIEIINTNGKNVIVGCVYRHPSMNVEEFNKVYLTELLSKLSREDKTIVLMGDFNIDLLKYDNNVDSADFVDLMYSNFLLPYITTPTRISTHSRTLIDNIFSNNIEDGLVSGNIITTVSDHYAQFFFMKDIKFNKNKRPDIYQHDFRNFDNKVFETKLNSINWKRVLQLEDKDVDISFQNFINTFNDLLEKEAPLKKVSNKDRKYLQKPWITRGILTSINNKNRIRKKYDRAKDQNRKIELYNRWKMYKNKINTLIKRSKGNHYKNFFQDNKNKVLKVWQGIKEIIHINKKSNQTIKNISVDGKLTSDRKTIADTFNRYFCSIPQKIENEIPATNTTPYQYLNNPIMNSFYLNPTTPSEIESQIKCLKNNKSSGPLSIPTKLFKEFKKSLSKPLSELVNLTFTEGKFPTAIKLGMIVPVYKRGEKSDTNNYRPISLLSNISKIIEKVMYTRLYSFLENNNILYKYQFGFRNNHSTNHALIEITESIREACDNGMFTCGVYLDFKKAFDTVNQDILLAKLDHYGIRGVTNNWFRSFLCGRTQCTSIDGNNSSLGAITHGVPQGSVLGPLLFVLFINDFHKSVKTSKVHHFADDTNLLLTGNSLKKINKLINHDLTLACKWLRANKISLNTSKTEIIIFRPKRKTIGKSLNFRISGQKINISKTVKYLGVILEEHLEWNVYINNLILKLNRAIGLLSKIRHYVPKFLLRTLYFTLFNSHLIYACQIWGQNEIVVRRLQPLQNKALRIINFKPFDYDANELYKENKILKLTDYIKLLNCIFVKEVLTKTSLKIFHSKFRQTSTTHLHNTRHSTRNAAQLTQSNTDFYGIQSIKHQATLDWNNLQHQIDKDLLLEPVQKVTTILKKYFLDSY